MPDARVLIVDDEPDLVELVALTLQRMGLTSQSAGTLRDAQRLVLTDPFDLVLCDMRLPDGDGLDFVDWLQGKRPGIPCAVITAHGNVETAVRALKPLLAAPREDGRTGLVVNISSIAAVTAMGSNAMYCASSGSAGTKSQLPFSASARSSRGCTKPMRSTASLFR